ncbi:MAG: hypothetical protein Q8M11_20215 [Sulfuritalea sp.]|nr:hypothetical protein [Sulfuritalea sp.]MDP1983615.1 hypothetical protein [Sulfuritalea sp.]
MRLSLPMPLRIGGDHIVMKVGADDAPKAVQSKAIHIQQRETKLCPLFSSCSELVAVVTLDDNQREVPETIIAVASAPTSEGDGVGHCR